MLARATEAGQRLATRLAEPLELKRTHGL